MTGALKGRGIGALRRLGALPAAFRVHERLQAADPRTLVRNLRYRGGAAPDGLPIPPAGLITLVAGNADIEGFLQGGAAAAHSIVETLAANGIEMRGVEALLDFGCGCGRVTRHWRALHHTAVTGTDANPELVAWCRANLAFARFDRNGQQPPLPYAAGAFDCLIALSVLTHLPEAAGRQWMDEFQRVLKPGGCLLVSTHGARYAGMLAPAERAAFEAGQPVVRYPELAGTNMCSAFHPERYVREVLARRFELIAFVPEGARGNARQDLVLLRRPGAAAA